MMVEEIIDPESSDIESMNFLFLFADCGMNCHKQCKDLVVFECKRRSKVTTVENSPASALASSLCPMGLKEHIHGKKISVNEMFGHNCYLGSNLVLSLALPYLSNCSLVYFLIYCALIIIGWLL